MRHLIDRRSIGACAAVLVVGLLASGCDWYGLGYLSGHNNDNSLDTTITPANVSSLTVHFSATDGTTDPVTPQAVVNGILYASNSNGVEAYSATGTTGCSGSPATCAPLWAYATGAVNTFYNEFLNGITISNGVLYASTSSGLEAFDATGKTGCSGAPVVCQALWSAPGTDLSSPTVANGTVFVTSFANGLRAFDANGANGCAGTPTVCSPIWTSSFSGSGNYIYGNVAVSAGVAFALYSDNSATGVIALDAGGARNCSGAPKVCSALWYDETANGPILYPIVSGTTLFVETSAVMPMGRIHGDLEAFDANGAKGCRGSVCGPTWRSPDGYTTDTDNAPLAAGEGAVFQPGFLNDSPFFAFAADGSSANPLWSSPNAGGVPLNVGGSVLYTISGSGTEIQGYDASGHAGCSGSPLICAPLWSAPGTDAIIANGTVYASSTNSSSDGEIIAYGLPA